MPHASVSSIGTLRRSAVVAELELGEVAMQVILAAVLVPPFIPHLKNEMLPSTVFEWSVRSSTFTQCRARRCAC